MITLKVYNNGYWYTLNNRLIDVTWSGDYKQCCRKLEFTLLANTENIGGGDFRIENADIVYLFEGSKELFRGLIYNIDKSSSDVTIKYLAYDYGVTIKDIEVSYNIKNKTANEFVDILLSDYVFKKGSIAKTTTKTDRVFIGVSMYEAIMTMYTEASKVDGKKYMIDFSENNLKVVEKGVVKLQVSFEEGKNLLSTSYTQSIENMVNTVILVDEKGNKKSTVQNQADRDKYGKFQKILQIQEGKDNNALAKNMLQGVTQTCSLDGYGDTTCVTGTGVTVKDNYTGLVGLFYIDSDTHKWVGGQYSISLALNFKNLMNEITSGQEEQEQVSTSSSGGTSVSGGREVNAEFTAYYPDSSAMEGGFLDAMGHRLDPSKLTCACPKDVAFNTKIQVKGTGTSRDNLVYKCNDRGSAIKVVNGVYHIDLLMANRTEANKFGRRRGKAIIGVTESSSNGGNSSKGSQVVELVKKQLGKPYVWGATGTRSFDCSGLTQWCYKQIGVNIPRVSGDQSRYGKSVSRDNLQLGDLLFFATMGGSRVSHVGMYVGDGKMVHAANPKKGVRTDDINSSYYRNAFTNARRVL